MKVLIVEDDTAKAAILTAAAEAGGLASGDVGVVPDAVNARDRLAVGDVELLLLDLQIPNRFGEGPVRNGGTELLHWLMRRPSDRLPPHVVAVTSYELDEDIAHVLTTSGIPVVRAEPSKAGWRAFITAYTKRAVGDHARRIGTHTETSPGIDALIVTAVDVEHEHARRVFGVAGAAEMRGCVAWSSAIIPSAGGQRRVVLGQCLHMGMPAASVLTLKGINLWQPKLVIATGICAGVRREVELGDLVVPDPCWDYGSGKLVNDGTLKPDPRPIELREGIRGLLRAGREAAPLSRWRDEWIADKPNTVPRLHVLPAASGAAVLADGHMVGEVQKQSRKVVGIDMENYGLYFACANSGNIRQPAFLAVKTVVDFADAEKFDKYQSYGANLSALFARWVVENHCP